MPEKKAKMNKEEKKIFEQLSEMKAGMDAVTESQIRVGTNIKKLEASTFEAAADRLGIKEKRTLHANHVTGYFFWEE